MSFRPVKPREFGSTKSVVGAVFNDAGGVKNAAFLIGKSVTQAYAYADDASPDQISFDRLRRLAAATGSTALAEALAADAGGYFVPGSPSEDSVNELMARGETKCGQLIADRLRDLDRAGAADASPQMRRDLDELLSTLAALRARLER